MQANDLS